MFIRLLSTSTTASFGKSLISNPEGRIKCLSLMSLFIIYLLPALINVVEIVILLILICIKYFRSFTT